MREGYTIAQCYCNGNNALCSTSTYYSYFFCGIRDDTVSRKSYINDGTNPEELFYNFNLNVNDTVRNRFCPGYVITAVDSIIIGGSYRKVYQLGGPMAIDHNS